MQLQFVNCVCKVCKRINSSITIQYRTSNDQHIKILDVCGFQKYISF